MKTIRKTKKAWLDTRGRMLPTEQLKEVSKSWDEKAWEQFLDSTDGSVEGLQLLSSKRLSCKTDYMTQSIFDLWAEKSDSRGSRSCNQVDPTFTTGWLPFRAIIQACWRRLELMFSIHLNKRLCLICAVESNRKNPSLNNKFIDIRGLSGTTFIAENFWVRLLKK